MVNTDKHRPQEDLGTNPIQAAVVSVFREGGLLHWETGLHRPLPDIVCRGYTAQDHLLYMQQSLALQIDNLTNYI